MQDPSLASLSLTHVHYNPNDSVSLFCAYLALVPQAIVIAYATLVWSTRDAEIILTFAGQLACEAINFVLKRVIKEERPMQLHGKGYGMPSSHSQFMVFFACSISLFLIVRHKPHEPSDHSPPLWARFILSFVLILTAALVAWSRVYLSYHTIEQVLAGAGAGEAVAVVWFLFTAYLRSSGLLAWILELEVFKYFRVRDLLVEEGVPDAAGWERWQSRRSKRATGSKKKTK